MNDADLGERSDAQTHAAKQSVRSAAFPRPPFTSLPRAAGILLTMAGTLALEILSAAGVPIPLPAAFLLLGVIYATYLGGVATGVTTGALALAYDVYHQFATQEIETWTEVPYARIITFAFVTAVAVWMVSRFRLRLDEQLVRERRLLEAAEAGRKGLENALLHIDRAQEAVRFQAKLLDVVGQAIISTDRQGRITYWNSAATRLLGWSREDAAGTLCDEILPGAPVAQAFEGTEQTEAEVVRVDGSRIPVLVNDSVIQNDLGEATGLVRTVSDLTTHRQNERVQRMLADASSVLAGSFDYESTVRAVARLCVPDFADCCIADLVGKDGLTQRVEVAHTDADLEAIARIMRPHEVSADSPHPVARVISTGQPTRFLIDDKLRRSVAQGDEEYFDAMKRLAYQCGIVVPLRAGGAVLGSLAFLRGANRALFDDIDATFADELSTRASVAIQQAKLFEEARLANKAKSDFLAVMSHELRTPLTTVTGYTDLLLAGVPEPLPGKTETYVRRIRVAAGHLLSLIDQILVYTRLEIGREQPHPERLHVADILREAAALIEPVSAERGVRFRVEPADAALTIESDLTMVRQILLNLLSNAVKFTDKGEVHLRAETSGDVVRFVVRDTGIGIAQEHLEQIFDPFWQVDQSATRRVGGTGLGLSVTRRLARFLGGEVTVESEVGRGSRFLVELPRDWRQDATAGVGGQAA